MEFTALFLAITVVMKPPTFCPPTRWLTSAVNSAATLRSSVSSARFANPVADSDPPSKSSCKSSVRATPD